MQISVVSQDSRSAMHGVFSRLWDRIFEFERRFSRFLTTSELSEFNRNAGTKQPVSAEFWDILVAAQKIGVETEGLYNPFILPVLQVAGYDHSLVRGHEHDRQDDHSRKRVAGVEDLEVGASWARIPPAAALDLGGCGKGYLADRLADDIEERVTGYWISLGGDVVCGGTDDAGHPWQVAIQKAAAGGERDIGRVDVPAGERYAIATSGTIARRGTKNGKPWHHLIDPRTLAPAATDMRLATVCGPSGFRADVLASCAVILGSKQAPEFLRRQGISDALLQAENDQRTFEVHFGNAIHLDGKNG